MVHAGCLMAIWSGASWPTIAYCIGCACSRSLLGITDTSRIEPYSTSRALGRRLASTRLPQSSQRFVQSIPSEVFRSSDDKIIGEVRNIVFGTKDRRGYAIVASGGFFPAGRAKDAALKAEGWGPSQIARKLNISRASVYRALEG
jgi:hypothetical protein